MSEKTYARPDDPCKIMVSAEHVYAFADRLPTIPGVRWIACRNLAYRYADDQTRAIDHIRAHFHPCDES